MRETLMLALPTATWRATDYRWFYDSWDQPQGLEAVPEARWERVSTLVSYEPNPKDQNPEWGAHAKFLRLKGLYADRSEGWPNTYLNSAKQFAHRYGLLGLFLETVSAPVLPSHVDPFFSWIAPNATFDQSGRLHEIDPSSEGKERLEKLFHERHDSSQRTGRKISLDSDRLALPHQLRFLPKGLTPLGRFESLVESHDPEMLSWKDIQDLYGVYIVLDEAAEPGVSFVSTREPLGYWNTEVERFPSPPCAAESLVGRMEGVTPHPIDGPDGKTRPGWRCPSLLKALYTMLYVDATNDDELRKCQDPSCRNYFRVGKRDKSRKYCPHPEPGKTSQCGSRVTSRRKRELEKS